jgi:hypothetical protein
MRDTIDRLNREFSQLKVNHNRLEQPASPCVAAVNARSGLISKERVNEGRGAEASEQLD